MEAKDNLKRSTEEYEAKLIGHIKAKLILLDEERKLKEILDLTAVEPSYVYENSDEWMAHMRKIGRINLDKEQIMMEKQLEDLNQKALDRSEYAQKQKEIEEKQSL